MSYNLKVSEESLIALLNQAIDHGGDVGGAYFCFPKELKDLFEKVITTEDGHRVRLVYEQYNSYVKRIEVIK